MQYPLTIDAKNADNRLQCPVFGLIKSVQGVNQRLNTIPQEILLEIEYFDIIGDGINISNDKSPITKEDGDKDADNDNVCLRITSTTDYQAADFSLHDWRIFLFSERFWICLSQSS